MKYLYYALMSPLYALAFLYGVAQAIMTALYIVGRLYCECVYYSIIHLSLDPLKAFPAALSFLRKTGKLEAYLKAQEEKREAERIDRITNPAKYLGKD